MDTLPYLKFMVEKSQQRLLDRRLVQREVYSLADSLSQATGLEATILRDLFSERYNIFFYVQVRKMITQTIFGDMAQDQDMAEVVVPPEKMATIIV